MNIGEKSLPEKFLPRAIVHRMSPLASRARLFAGSRIIDCGLGKAGIRALKREGDMASPRGCWGMVRLMYRADRTARPRSLLPVRMIRPDDGWCDAPGDRNYNRLVKLPYQAGAEKLWRDDGAYDLLVVLDYNYSSRSMGRGSAIFIHLEHDDNRASAGCLTMAERDLRWLVRHLSPGCKICIQ